MIGSVSQKSKNQNKISKKTQILALFDSPEEDTSLEITSKVTVVESSTGKGEIKQE